MTELILGCILLIVLFAMLFGFWYVIKKARSKERITLIEKGIDVKELNALLDKRGYFPWLKIGILITGIAIGALVVALILVSPVGENFKDMPGFAIGVILLFGGVAMILANYLDRPVRKNE